MQASESTASATLTNQGTTLADEPQQRIFGRGVSDPRPPPLASKGGHRGQGLLEAKTCMAQMGGTLSARNTADGVAFVLTFQRLG